MRAFSSRQLGDDRLADDEDVTLAALLADMNLIHLLGKTLLAQEPQEDGGADVVGPGLLQPKNFRELTNRNTLISHRNLSLK